MDPSGFLSNPSARFGCRQMAFYSNQTPSINEQAARSWMLQQDPNALIAQAAPGHWPSQTLGRPSTLEDLAGLNQKGSKDAFGLVATGPNTPPHQAFRFPGSASANPGVFAQGVATMQQSGSQVLMAHALAAVKRKPDSPPSSVLEAPPFQAGGATLMLNGKFSGIWNPIFEQEIAQQYPTGAGPKGRTGAERFLYLYQGRLTQMAQQQGIAPEQVSARSRAQVFARLLHQVNTLSTPDYNAVAPNALGLSGRIQTGPDPSLILTDHGVQLAYRGARGLFLGKQLVDSTHYQYILCSELPQHSPPTTQWAEIPVGHMVAIAPDANGMIKPMIEPMSALLA